MTVKQLLDELSSAELTEWMAYDRISPIGPERDELRTGILASMMANMFRGKGAHGQPAKPSDFLLFKPQPPATAKVRAVFAALGHLRKSK